MMDPLKGILFSVLTTTPTTSAELVEKVGDHCRTKSYYEYGNRERLIPSGECMRLIFKLTALEVQHALREMRHDVKYDINIVSSSKGYYLREVGNNELSFEAKQAIGGLTKAIKAGALTRKYVYRILAELNDFPLSAGQVDDTNTIYRRVTNNGKLT